MSIEYRSTPIFPSRAIIKLTRVRFEAQMVQSLLQRFLYPKTHGQSFNENAVTRCCWFVPPRITLPSSIITNHETKTHRPVRENRSIRSQFKGSARWAAPSRLLCCLGSPLPIHSSYICSDQSAIRSGSCLFFSKNAALRAFQIFHGTTANKVTPYSGNSFIIYPSEQIWNCGNRGRAI